MQKKGIKSLMLGTALSVYNAVAALSLHILMWRNFLWKEERWIKNP